MFIDNLYIFALISQSDISNINGLTMILKITAVLNVSTYIITSITACPIRLAVICNIRIMHVSTFITGGILYISILVICKLQ